MTSLKATVKETMPIHHFKKREGNWAELTFAKASGPDTRDTEKNSQ